MAVYRIVEVGDEILRQKAQPVPEINKNIKKLLKDLADTLYAAKGAGLAAPQIGISKRAIVVDVGDGLHALVNPVIAQHKGNETAVEGCLSIPGVAGEVTRAAKVVVKALNGDGEQVTVTATGMGARCLQHEIDHLDGILFTDKVIRFVDEQK